MRNLPNLELLTLSLYSGDGVDRIIALANESPKLDTLVLENSGIGDDDVQQLARLERLRVLDLSGTKITDKCLEYIGDMTQLESLQIRATRITDEGLKHLSNLSNLIYLGLSWNQGISDAGIDHITVLTGLEELGIAGAQVTPNGCARLQQALPGCTIVGP